MLADLVELYSAVFFLVYVDLKVLDVLELAQEQAAVRWAIARQRRHGLEHELRERGRPCALLGQTERWNTGAPRARLDRHARLRSATQRLALACTGEGRRNVGRIPFAINHKHIAIHHPQVYS